MRHPYLYKTGDAPAAETRLPFGDHRAIDANEVSGLLLAEAPGSSQNDPGAPDFSLRGLGFFDHGFEFPLLDGINCEDANRAGHA